MPDGSPFEAWLSKELKTLNADEEVFVPYILSIVDNEEDDDETRAESIDDLLEGICDSKEIIKKLRNNILEQWNTSKGDKEDKEGGEATVEKKLESLDLGAQLASITECQTAAYAASRAAASSEAPDKSVKEAILAQYAGAVEESSGEEDDGGGQGEEPKNMNAEGVARAEQEKREKSRQAAAAKKDKDKEDREKQKKQAEDRKKKAQDKAAKGERRR